MKKIKQVFPSRNYITVDSYGDVEVVFNPVGDGFEGDDKLMFRKGRWAFRVNDFLSGKVMADGSKEGMGRKVYSLNLVYDDKDGEPVVNTTYVDPTSVIPLDGSVVDVVGAEKLAQEDTLFIIKNTQDNVNFNLDDFRFKWIDRKKVQNVTSQSLDADKRYSAGTVFYFGLTRFISLRADCVSISVGSEILLLGDMSEYNNGTVKRLDGVKFSRSDCTKVIA